MKYLLKNGTIVSGSGILDQDVLIDGEKIVRVGENLPAEDAEVIDVTGKLLFPGFIDGHTHFDLEVAGTVTADDFGQPFWVEQLWSLIMPLRTRAAIR